MYPDLEAKLKEVQALTRTADIGAYIISLERTIDKDRMS